MCSSNVFPIALHSIPISFALSSNVVTYITNPKEKITTYIFSDFSTLDYFFGGDGPIKNAHHKRK
jgi:hypothetical protein